MRIQQRTGWIGPCGETLWDNISVDHFDTRTVHNLLFTVLTNDCTIMSNTTVTNNVLLHVSTFKMPSSGSSLCLAKITYRFSGLNKIKMLKYKIINFNKLLIVQRDKIYMYVLCI